MAEWTKDEKSACIVNDKAMNAIFMALSPNEFSQISQCKIAKRAWVILEITHEGTKTVKSSKLQNFKFEEIMMQNDETFDEFYAKLNTIRNSTINLGKKVSNAKMVRKIMRSLPERLRPKVTAIEESNNLDSMRVEELVGSLQTYENTLPQPKKSKSIASKTVKKEANDSSDEKALNEEDLAMFVRRFIKISNLRRKTLETLVLSLLRNSRVILVEPPIERKRNIRTLAAYGVMNVQVLVTFGLNVQIFYSPRVRP